MPVAITIRSIFLLLALYVVSGCKKDKIQIIEGILLYSKTNPTPVGNYTLEMYQRGGNAIIMGTSSSSASATTDNDGRFRFEFTPGKGYFAGIPARNSASTSLTGFNNSTFPGMRRDVFPDSAFFINKRIYLVKEIQQYFIQIKALRNVVATDSLGIRVSTKSGEIERLYTGLNIASGTTVIIDTIPNVIATNLSVFSGGYQNPFWMPSTFNTYRSSYFTFPNNLGTEDEERRTCEIVLY